MATPIVRVIGHTQFFGVPRELLPETPKNLPPYSEWDSCLVLRDKKQDKGSDLARLIECAGRTCYDSYGVGRPSSEYHHHIKESGHGSTTEHAVINFYLDGISRSCSHELVRHRAGCAISQRSTRYVDESGSDWVLHPLIDKLVMQNSSTSADINAAISAGKTAYDSIVRTLQDALILGGVDKFTARKQARGAARGLLGNALCTSMVWSANIRALRTVIEQRANPAADAEIRLLANRLYEEAFKVCPEYFDDYEKVECPDGIGYGLVTTYRKI